MKIKYVFTSEDRKWALDNKKLGKKEAWEQFQTERGGIKVPFNSFSMFFDRVTGRILTVGQKKVLLRLRGKSKVAKKMRVVRHKRRISSRSLGGVRAWVTRRKKQLNEALALAGKKEVKALPADNEFQLSAGGVTITVRSNCSDVCGDFAVNGVLFQLSSAEEKGK